MAGKRVQRPEGDAKITVADGRVTVVVPVGVDPNVAKTAIMRLGFIEKSTKRGRTGSKLEFGLMGRPASATVREAIVSTVRDIKLQAEQSKPDSPTSGRWSRATEPASSNAAAVATQLRAATERPSTDQAAQIAELTERVGFLSGQVAVLSVAVQTARSGGNEVELSSDPTLDKIRQDAMTHADEPRVPEVNVEADKDVVRITVRFVRPEM